MKKLALLFSTICILFVLISVGIANELLLGDWRSVVRSKGGLGSAKAYKSDGIVYVTYGALVDFKYTLQGNMLIFSFPDADDIVQTVEVQDTKLTLIDQAGNKEELTRAEGDPKAGIIGKWTGDHYTGQKQTLHFTASKNCYLSVPMIFAKGKYQVKGNTLIESYEGKDDYVWIWSIQEDVLTLTSTKNEKVEKYKRKQL